MNAAAILVRLRDLGITAEVRGAGLALRPASVIPSELLAELKAHKMELLALLAANDRDSWGLTAAERAEALARLNARAETSIAPACPLPSPRTASALPAGSQDGPPDSSPPAAAPALLAYIRDRLRCSVTLAGSSVMIAPTWRCPPRVVAAALRVAPQLRRARKPRRSRPGGADDSLACGHVDPWDNPWMRSICATNSAPATKGRPFYVTLGSDDIT